VLPKELSDILEEYDAEDFDVIITNVNYDISTSKFDFQLSIKSHTQDNFDRTWTVSTKQYRQSRISFERASSVEIVQEHPILWQFSDRQSEIYFTGSCKNLNNLYFDLYNVHKTVFQNLLLFDESLNNVLDFNRLMSSSTGLLAKGPQKLLNRYAEILEQYNLKHSIIGDRMPTYWDGTEHLNEVGNAKVLFVDNSYVIADSFQFF
jgi:hypothetical protein